MGNYGDKRHWTALSEATPQGEPIDADRVFQSNSDNISEFMEAVTSFITTLAECYHAHGDSLVIFKPETMG